jgi:hypothetical protein
LLPICIVTEELIPNWVTLAKLPEPPDWRILV